MLTMISSTILTSGQNTIRGQGYSDSEQSENDQFSLVSSSIDPGKFLTDGGEGDDNNEEEEEEEDEDEEEEDYKDRKDGHSSGQSKRKRTSFRNDQLKMMRNHFNINHNPDSKELEILSKETNLSKRVLQVWFQNARAKWRKIVKISKDDHKSSIDLEDDHVNQSGNCDDDNDNQSHPVHHHLHHHLHPTHHHHSQIQIPHPSCLSFTDQYHTV